MTKNVALFLKYNTRGKNENENGSNGHNKVPSEYTGFSQTKVITSMSNF